jgi:general secretion pathway protein K
MMQMPVAKQQGQSGVALITVLLITAVITIIVASMATQQSVDIRRTANILDRNQAYLFTLGAEDWAKRVLDEDRKKGSLDYRLEDWAVSLPPIEVEGGSISGFIQDRNGCFNLNNLVENGVGRPDDINRFRRLLAALELSPDLADAIVDWIDTDNQVSYPGGAESDYYARLDPPYAIANRTLISSSELAAVKGMTPEIMAKLRPQVCALPKRTRININTATPEVLMTLAPNMTPAIVDAIIEARDAPVSGVPSKGYFKNVSELYTIPQFNAILNSAIKAQIQQDYGVASDFFLVTANGHYAEADVILYSLLERSGSTITTYYRAQGSY